ncbi:MAG: endoflagellar filament sheath protein [Leptospiraceae bacterium]|nr:endoflagellar filament sheath protein [Leptospiraceae bacterium]
MKTQEIIKKALPALAGGLAAVAILTFSQTEVARAEVSTAIGNDVSGSELRAITIESWDVDYTGSGYGWQVLTDKEKANPQYEFNFANNMMEREVKLIKGTPRDIKYNQNYEQAYILGVKFAFTFPGWNVVTIRPPRVDHYMVERPRPHLNEIALADSTTQRNRSCFQDASLSQYTNSNRPVYIDCVNGIDMPGEVKAISVWVMGRGNEYELEGWIEDWRGDTHILKFGSIDFIGWRPLTVQVPSFVPQDISSFPQIKTLVFRQFKIRSRPETSLEPVYVFFDELRVLTDVFEVHFDGASIDFDAADCERKNRLYRLIKDNARYPDRWPELTNCSESPKPAPDNNVPGPDSRNTGGGT